MRGRGKGERLGGEKKIDVFWERMAHIIMHVYGIRIATAQSKE